MGKVIDGECLQIMKKKIMLVEECKVVNYAGGIEKVMCNFANEFIKRGYDVSYICLDTEKGLPLYPLDSQVEFINLAFQGERYVNFSYLLKKAQKEILRAIGGSELIINGKKITDPKYKYFEDQFIKRLGYSIKKIRPDVIICVSSESTYLAQAACNNDIPTITMCHVDTNRMVKYDTINQRMALLKTKAVQVLMPSFVEPIKSMGVKDVFCISNIVEEVAPDFVANLSAEKNEFRIVTVGRVEPIQKRPHLLVEAFAKLAEEFSNWSLDIYGAYDEGGYKKSIDKFIKDNNLNDKVVFRGVSTNIKQELQKADIFAFPSSFEGFGLALTEAMAVGLPVVGYKNCSAVNEIIIDGENGYLCEDGSSDLAAKLALLMRNKQKRIQMGAVGRKNMEQYAPVVIWDKWEELIQRYSL